MDILICTAKDQEPWRAEMSSCLPEARVHVGLDAPGCDYAVVWKPPADMFDRQRGLKALFSLGAGVDGLLAMPSLPRDIPLVRLEDGGMADQMVEYALYVALREFRRFPCYQRDNALGHWAPQPVRARREFSIGVLGLGVLGGAVAHALADFGFAVSGWSRSPKSIASVQCKHGEDGLNTVLARSQLLMLFLPLTRDTDHLIDHARLARLPVGATVVNLSRGELFDDADLIRALDSGQLARAHLDVFRQEPLPPEHAFWRHSQVEVTPHVAALTDVAVACAQVADKIRRLQAGDTVSGIVDRAREY